MQPSCTRQSAGGGDSQPSRVVPSSLLSRGGGGPMRIASLLLMLIGCAAAWSDEQFDPDAPNDAAGGQGHFAIGFPFNRRLQFAVSPFAGAGPFHFSRLSNLP